MQATEVGNFHFYTKMGAIGLGPEDYGGISGAPCFLVREDQQIRLVGFATGYAPNAMNSLSFTYVNFIRPDGTINCMI
jgi:hypothetical protein